MSEPLSQICPPDSPEALFRIFMAECQDGIFATDTQGVILMANRSAEHWLFHNASPVSGRHFGELFDPMQTATLNTMLDAMHHGIRPPLRELLVDGAQGAILTVQLSAFPVHDDSGVLVGAGFVARDITRSKQVEAELDFERNRFRLAVEAAPLALLMVDENGRIELANKALETMFGFSADEMIGQSMEMLLPDHLRAHHAGLRHDFFSKPAFRQLGHGRELLGQTRSGALIQLEIALAPIRTHSGNAVIAAITDISERKTQLNALHEREVRYRSVIESVPDGFLIIHRDGRITVSNPAYSRMSGYSRRELLQLNVATLNATDNQHLITNRIQNVLLQGYERFETAHRRKDGSVWPVEVTVCLIPSLDELFVFVRDLTELKLLEEERRQAEQQIRIMAWHDYLTRLPNRWLLIDRLRQALSAARRNHTYGALLFIDIDHFKWLNDSLGHEMGDLLLIQVSRRLLENIRAEDTAARFGGDEFVVMLTGLSDNMATALEQGRQTGNKLLRALNIPYQLRTHLYRCTPSIGITLFQDDEDTDAIFRRADRAMYLVKSSGRNAVHMHEHAA